MTPRLPYRPVADQSEEPATTRTIGAYEAKTHLPRLLDEVEAGDEITITKHGRPVAALVPVRTPRRAEIDAAIEGLRALRARQPAGTGTLRELVEDGRRP